MKKSGTRITVAVAADMLLIVILLCIITAVVYKGKTKELMLQTNQAAFAVFEGELEDAGADVDYVAASYVRDPALLAAIKKGDAADVQSVMEEALIVRHMFGAFFDKNGELIVSLGSKVPKELQGELAMGDAIQSGYYKDASMPISYRIYQGISDGGTRIGGLLIGYDLSNTVLVDNIKERAGTEATLFNGNTRINTTIVNKETGKRAIGTNMAPEIEEQVLVQGKQISGETFVVNENMLYEYKPLKGNSGEIIGAMFVGSPTASMDALFKKATLTLMGGALILAALCLVFLYVFIKKGVTEPINKVVGLADRIRDGELHAAPLVIKQTNEAGVLARTMNKTVENLNAYISDVTGLLTSIAQRDLTNESEMDYVGDFAALKTATQNIQQNIRDFLREIDSAASVVYSNASQMADSAERMAAGATEQAATVQQFSASISEIAANVDHNAADAQSVKKLADQVEVKIDQQNEKMEQMLVSMREIEERSAKIQKIIKNIDDIAFQTNILALNAAVEAARAGQAGKGFAVVADEVRNLATKSTAAARDTTTLIQASIEAVQKGSGLVTETAESLEDIVGLSKRTNALIENISQHSGEQAMALREVSAGVSQISDVVQQNSAVAEESHAASEELSKESERLSELIKAYKF
ncbi:MAG: methyl-accepting chemotaxis protein [Clostridia bacterium]|nr:methyl-accepting chemotaxis protein [Clostridia bacterium]